MTVTVIDRDPIPKLPSGAERKRLRLAFGVNQAELAETLNVTRQMIIRYEKGANPTGDTLIAYANILTAWKTRESRKRAS